MSTVNIYLCFAATVLAGHFLLGSKRDSGKDLRVILGVLGTGIGLSIVNEGSPLGKQLAWLILIGALMLYGPNVMKAFNSEKVVKK